MQTQHAGNMQQVKHRKGHFGTQLLLVLALLIIKICPVTFGSTRMYDRVQPKKKIKPIHNIHTVCG